MSHFTDQIKSTFVGHDIFISYARGDAIGYALALADRLGALGFKCYLDQYGTSPNDEVDEQVLRELRISRVFVLIGSRLAIDSKPIEQEVNCFKSTARAIIPIDVDRALRETRLYNVIRGLPVAEDLQVLNETEENLGNDNPGSEIAHQIAGIIDNLRKPEPSRRIINRVVSTISYTKRTQLQRAMLWSGSAFLLLSIGAAVFALVLASRAENRRKIAANAVEVAQSNLDTANEKRGEAETKLGRAITEEKRLSTVNGALQQIDQAARLRNERPREALAVSAAAFRAAPETVQSVSALASTLQYYRHLRSMMLTDATDPVISLTSAQNGRLIAFNQQRDGQGPRVAFYDTKAQRRLVIPKSLNDELTEAMCTPIGSLCVGLGWRNGASKLLAWRFVSPKGRLQVAPIELTRPPINPGHEYAVTSDERIVAYDSREKRFLIWSLAKRDEAPRELACSGDDPTALAVSPDNKTLTFATIRQIPSEQSARETVAAQINYCALDKAGVQPPPTEFPGRSIQSVSKISYSQDGKFLAAASGGGVSLIDAATRAVIAFVKGADREFAFVPLRDSSLGTSEIHDSNRAFQLLVTSDTRRITSWEITKEPMGGERLFKHSQEDYAPGTTSLAALRDGANTLLSGGADGTISFWDFSADPFLETASYTHPAPSRPRVSVHPAFFSSDPDELFVVDARKPRGAPIKMPIRIHGIRSADINEEATLLAIVRRTWANGTHGGVELWNVENLKTPKRMPSLYDGKDATCVAFGRGGRVALGYDNGRIVILDVNARRNVQELVSPMTVISPSLGRYPGVESIAFRPDGKLLASSSPHRPLNLWDVETGTLILSFERSEADRSQHPEQDLAFSLDGKKLFSHVDRVNKVWDVDPYSWAERALRLASFTPALPAPLPVAPIVGLTSDPGNRNSDPRAGYWRYESGDYSGNIVGNPSPMLYIQVVQGQLAVTECDRHAECLKATPRLNFLEVPRGLQSSKSLTVLPDGRLEYRALIRVNEGEGSILVYYTRANP